MDISNENKTKIIDKLNTLIIVMIVSGIFGFIYETIFYRIDLGYFVKRGSTFGPWIPIYFFGGGLIFLLTYNLRKKPFLVFISNCIITGLLEYLTGFALFEFFNTRLWDYNTEIWNFRKYKWIYLFKIYFVFWSIKLVSNICNCAFC